MNWWKRLKRNTPARFGAIILLIFYILVIGADFFAPYDPFESQIDGSLLPPTHIYWQDPAGKFNPVVYPTTLGRTDINTGDRLLQEDKTKPCPINLFVKGSPYNLFEITIPIPTQWKLTPFPIPEKLIDITFFKGIPLDRHLFGVVGEGRINVLGTDEQSRDQFSRLLFGGRISLFIGIFGIAISYPLGMLVGGISGYFGGLIDTILMRLMEVLMTIPGLYLLVTLSGFLLTVKADLPNNQRFLLIIIITSLISWTGLARVIRGQVLSLKQTEFVESAQAMGAKPLYIIIRHILPQTASYIIISATLSIPGFIIAESVLSLIGLGIQQPDPSWGNLLSLATNASILLFQPWLIWSPAILIILTVLSFNLLGDGLRDALDPRSLEK
jgi:peptide/nickel transport system permease protein